MRVTYRLTGNKEYWRERWESIEIDSSMENDQVYPLKYSKLIVKDKAARILEAGCGAGRILRYYHENGYSITGFDFIGSAVKNLKRNIPSLEILVADVVRLPFHDNEFKYLLAFGLYHNLEYGLDEAIRETHRVLEPGGVICASFRADSIQNRLIDWIGAAKVPSRIKSTRPRKFHKLNFKKNECLSLFNRSGFRVRKIYPVENMTFFYKFRIFRSQKQTDFDETSSRAEGYRLSRLGELLQAGLMYLFPLQFCNLFVVIAQKD